MRKLSDKQWSVLQSLLPRQDFSRGGKPRADDKKTVEGILWILTTPNGTNFPLSMAPPLPTGDDLPSGRSKEYGEIYGKNFWLSLINRRSLRGR